MAVQGLKIVAPCTSYDAKGLMKAAIREDNPVIFLSHKKTDAMKGMVPEEEYIVPIGKADVKRKGSDVTIVTIAYMTHLALSAAAKLQEKGISAEVIDLRSWAPLDKQSILDSVKKTGRLVVMVEEPKTGGAAGEVAATVAEEAFQYLKAPIRRVCGQDTPVPFSPVLEKFWMPSEEALIKAVNDIIQ
jgi:acetoin:2,6-dichlorophenolindophenol oxidoreductase subunit beta